MPLLRLNGWDVSSLLAANDATRDWLEVGARAEVQDGAERVGRRRLLRPLKLPTIPLSYTDWMALSGYVGGEGDLWQWADLYSAKGLGPSSGYVATLRPAEGKFGQAVAVERGTTNLVPLANQQFAGWTAVSSATITLTQGQALASGSETVTAAGATRIQSSGGGSATKYQYTTSVTSGAGTSSLWVRNQGLTTVTVQSAGGGVSDSVAAGVTKLVTVATNNLDGLQAAITFRLPASTDTLDLVCFQPQIEQFAFRTSFTTGTRAAGLLPYGLGLGLDAFTVMGWVRLTSTGTTRALWGAGPDWKLETGSSNNDRLTLTYTDTSAATQTLSTGAVSGLDLSAGFVHVAVTYSRQQRRLRIYTGGTQRASSSAADLTTSGTATFGWGADKGGSGATPGDALLDECWALPYEAPAALVAAMAARTTACPAFPLLSADGDLYGRTLNVLGRAEQARLAMLGDGALRETGAVVLREV